MYFSKPLLTILAVVGFVNAFSGNAIHFQPGLGACGYQNTENDLVVALSVQQYAGGSHCNENISVYYNGKSVVATVVDVCFGCGQYDIDLSPKAFEMLADKSFNKIPVMWYF